MSGGSAEWKRKKRKRKKKQENPSAPPSLSISKRKPVGWKLPLVRPYSHRPPVRSNPLISPSLPAKVPHKGFEKKEETEQEGAAGKTRSLLSVPPSVLNREGGGYWGLTFSRAGGIHGALRKSQLETTYGKKDERGKEGNKRKHRKSQREIASCAAAKKRQEEEKGKREGKKEQKKVGTAHFPSSFLLEVSLPF